MVSDFFGFGARGDVFAQVGEDGGDIFGAERLRGGQGVFKGFSGHETGDGAADEFVVGGVVA